MLSYYPIIFSKPLKEVHPEWLMQFLDDGRPEPENEGWFCLNSPFRDWLPDCLGEYMELLDIDGLYFDDVNWGSHAEGAVHPVLLLQLLREIVPRRDRLRDSAQGRLRLESLPPFRQLGVTRRCWSFCITCSVRSRSNTRMPFST